MDCQQQTQQLPALDTLHQNISFNLPAMSKSISLFGLGAMGKALATKYVDTGYTTTVWNRSPSKADSLVAKGAKLASTVAEGLEASNLIILCLLVNDTVKDTLSKATSSLAGKTIVNLTNGTPEQARELSDWITSLGAEYIHGGIMAVPSMIGTPHSVLLYSSKTPDVFTRIEPDLAHIGTSRFVGEDPGSASLHDLALLSGMYGLFSGFFQATALVRTQPGTTATGFLELLAPWLSAMTQYLGVLAAQIDNKDYSTQSANMFMQVTAMQNIVDTFQAQGVTSSMFLPLLELMKKAVEGGHADSDISAVIEFTNVERK
ncbi:hypothetical protein BJY04DRAFT_196686 [Aspergillus karnatakaensis]|uniref:NAD(P)-dependent oxidoreductase n=1 Tax=Aspergillus karnatakaensis TaxID=1810916 RepID=UPI003CCD9D6D